MNPNDQFTNTSTIRNGPSVTKVIVNEDTIFELANIGHSHHHTFLNMSGVLQTKGNDRHSHRAWSCKIRVDSISFIEDISNTDGTYQVNVVTPERAFNLLAKLERVEEFKDKYMHVLTGIFIKN